MTINLVVPPPLGIKLETQQKFQVWFSHFGKWAHFLCVFWNTPMYYLNIISWSSSPTSPKPIFRRASSREVVHRVSTPTLTHPHHQTRLSSKHVNCLVYVKNTSITNPNMSNICGMQSTNHCDVELVSRIFLCGYGCGWMEGGHPNSWWVTSRRCQIIGQLFIAKTCARQKSNFYCSFFYIWLFLFVCRLNVLDVCNSMEWHCWVGFCDGAVS